MNEKSCVKFIKALSPLCVLQWYDWSSGKYEGIGFCCQSLGDPPPLVTCYSFQINGSLFLVFLTVNNKPLQTDKHDLMRP